MNTLQPGSVKSVCKHWISGHCRQGSACLFLHGQESEDYVKMGVPRNQTPGHNTASLGSRSLMNMSTPSAPLPHQAMLATRHGTAPQTLFPTTGPMPSGLTHPMQIGLANPMLSGLAQSMQPGLTQFMQSGLAQPMQSGLAQPMQSGLAQPMQSGLVPPMQSGLAQPMQSGLVPPMQSGLAPPMQSGLAPPMQSGLAPPMQSGLVPPMQSCLAPPMQSGLAPPMQSGLPPAIHAGLIQVQMTPLQYQQHLLLTQVGLLGQHPSTLPLGLLSQRPDLGVQASSQQAVIGSVRRSRFDSGPGVGEGVREFDNDPEQQAMPVGSGVPWQQQLAMVPMGIDQSELLYSNDALRMQQRVLAPSQVQQVPITQNPAYAGTLGNVLMPSDTLGMVQPGVGLPQAARSMVLGQQCLLPLTGETALGQQPVTYQVDVGKPLIPQTGGQTLEQQTDGSQPGPKLVEEVATVPSRGIYLQPSRGIYLQPSGGPKKKKSRFHDIDKPDPNEHPDYNPENPTEDEDHMVDFVDKIMAGITPKIIQPEELTKKKPISFKNMFIPTRSNTEKAPMKIETGQIFRRDSRSKRVCISSRGDYEGNYQANYPYGDSRDASRQDNGPGRQRYDGYDPQRKGRDDNSAHTTRRHESQRQYSPQDYKHVSESSYPNLDDRSARLDSHRSRGSRHSLETSLDCASRMSGNVSRASGDVFNYGHQDEKTKEEADGKEAKSSTLQAKTDEDLGIMSHRAVQFDKDMTDFIQGFMVTAGKYKGGLIRVTKTYRLPANCIGMCPPKMNAEAWDILTKKAQTRDEILQDVQRWFATGVIPLVLQANQFGKNSQSMKEICRFTSDALNVLAYVCSNLSIKRRLLMRYSLHSKYKLLCRKEHPVSALLFGPNLAQDLLAIKSGTFKVPDDAKTAAEDNNDDPEADNYKPMFFADLALPGENVDESVASMVNMACSKDSDISDLREAYKIPANCKSIAPPDINPQVWSLVSRSGLDLDNRLQDVQLSVAEGMVPLMFLVESVHEKRHDENESLSFLTHALLLLCNSMFQLNKVRMDAMRKSLPEKVHGYCSFRWPGAENMNIDSSF